MCYKFGIVSLLCISLWSLYACDDDGGVPLSVEALYGGWQNADGETNQVRVFVFEESNSEYSDLAGLSPVYRLYLFNQNQTPLMVQRGTFGVADSHLLTNLIWSSADIFGDPGTSYANEIYVWEGDSFVMESNTASSERTYSKIDPSSYK